MDLKEYCYSLSSKDLFELAIHVCENGLFIWDNYAMTNTLIYRDSVVGLNHEIRKEILSDSLAYCKQVDILNSSRLDNLLEEFRDPVVSLQDFDWEPPYTVKHIFYAVYNLVSGIKEKKTIFNELTHYVCVNQAVDALIEDGELKPAEIVRMIGL